MITQKRAAYYSADKTAKLVGRSIDTKLTNVPNGSEYTEIDTGRVYVFDAENTVWVERK